MSTTLEAAVAKYLRSGKPSLGTRAEYKTTLHKWSPWGGGGALEDLTRKDIREFLDWVYERAIADGGTNAGRTTNKAREQIRAVLLWAWDQEIIGVLPRFPSPKEQRDVAGRHYLTKAEINALYFATHKMHRPRGWDAPHAVGRYWRAALVLFFNYGLDSGTVWGACPEHEPLQWRHVSWDQVSPDSQAKQRSPWGWLYYRRTKTGKVIYRPMNGVVHAHLKIVASMSPQPDDLILIGGGSRPNQRFQELCRLAGLTPKKNFEKGTQELWLLKDIRKTCATYYDQHVPESSIEILGHSVGGITHRHYAHRAPLAFRAIMTLPQPQAFTALVHGFESECSCCRRRFDDAEKHENESKAE